MESWMELLAASAFSLLLLSGFGLLAQHRMQSLFEKMQVRQATSEQLLDAHCTLYRTEAEAFRQARLQAYEMSCTQLETFIKVSAALRDAQQQHVTWLAAETDRLDLLLAEARRTQDRTDAQHTRLETSCKAMEDQWHRLDQRTRALVDLCGAFQRRTLPGPNDTAPVEYTPWTPEPGESIVEVIDAQGACRLFRLPARPEEPTHPEIQRALSTPGWKLRYPDGREEEGVKSGLP